MTQQGFWSDFRNFAVKGNVMELAIAVVVGNAFSGVVNSLVADIISPFVGLLTNHVDFKTLSWSPHAGVTVGYGSFLQALFNFLIVSLSIFIVLRGIASMRRRLFRQGEKATPPDQKPAQERLLEEIRDLLKEHR